eukprot:GEZU01007072.1.p1 GENE.GEZU01007072.1~~GEZU01007072.1.p1  ORF type:complete len:229 (+),score=8.04 GEZU01007072.1:77-688(+)
MPAAPPSYGTNNCVFYPTTDFNVLIDSCPGGPGDSIINHQNNPKQALIRKLLSGILIIVALVLGASLFFVIVRTRVNDQIYLCTNGGDPEGKWACTNIGPYLPLDQRVTLPASFPIRSRLSSFLREPMSLVLECNTLDCTLGGAAWFAATPIPLPLEKNGLTVKHKNVGVVIYSAASSHVQGGTYYERLCPEDCSSAFAPTNE